MENTGIRFKIFRAIGFSLFVFLLSFAVAAQAKYPKEIRGYKVYERKISVENRSGEAVGKDKPEVVADIGAPRVTNVSIGGATIEVSPQIESANQSGTIDFLAFKDFRVNDLAVEIEEYKTAFAFEKNKVAALPAPVKIRLRTANAARGAFGEIKNRQDEWTITGTIFVFGRFKKFGFNFKRVVPIEINLKIKNPLLD